MISEVLSLPPSPRLPLHPDPLQAQVVADLQVVAAAAAEVAVGKQITC